jgi:hypothetical protein
LYRHSPVKTGAHGDGPVDAALYVSAHFFAGAGPGVTGASTATDDADESAARKKTARMRAQYPGRREGP